VPPLVHLSRAFYRRPAPEVARALLGCLLVHERGGERLVLRLVETEAYLGAPDRASHAWGGRRTARNESLYLPGGHAYVYFIYGMYDMLNVVTRPAGCPEAVLLRALEPLEGIEAMRALRHSARRNRDLASGPGKLCRALGITRRLNGTDLLGPELWIEPGGLRRGEHIGRGPRIGVDYAGRDALRPLRFYIEGNPHVSRSLTSRRARVKT
jgi:DNA-3-methyladenine glycosylase